MKTESGNSTRTDKQQNEQTVQAIRLVTAAYRAYPDDTALVDQINAIARQYRSNREAGEHLGELVALVTSLTVRLLRGIEPEWREQVVEHFELEATFLENGWSQASDYGKEGTD